MKAIPSYNEMLRQLVALPSISSNNPRIDQSNLLVVELLADWLQSLDFDVEIMPLPGEDGKANLIASWGKGPGGLVLSGHSDTVPYDENLWDSDPFNLTEKNNRLYGLGATDMKGFFPLAIEAIQHFKPEQIKEPLIFVATANEETSMSGAKALVDQGRPKARYAVIGEPTGLRPIRMHKGISMEAVRVTGQSGHSSDPSLGNNAIEAMHSALSTIMRWRESLSTRVRNELFVIPFTTINLGCIHGGDNPNRICGSCELQIDIRPIPGMHLEELRAELKKLLAPVAKQHKIKIELEALFPGIPAFETPANSHLVKMAEKLTGHSAEAVAFGTEAPFFQTLETETIILGPGHIDQAHQPNEFIALDQVSKGISQVRHLIQTLCVD